MIVSMNVPVVDTEGFAYKLVGFIVSAGKRQLTHLLAADPKNTAVTYRVPLQHILEANPQKIRLNCPREHMPLFTEKGVGEVVVKTPVRIKATDGFMGHLHKVNITPKQGIITALIMQEGLLHGHKHVSLPDSILGQFEENVVHIKADKKSISILPKVA